MLACWTGADWRRRKGCCDSQSLNLHRSKRWGTRPPSSVRLSSTGMRCWPTTCMRATSSSGTPWIPTVHTESPTSTTLHCTMLPGTPWHACSGRSQQTKCSCSPFNILELVHNPYLPIVHIYYVAPVQVATVRDFSLKILNKCLTIIINLM